MKLLGKTAIVTGGYKGLGLAITRAFLEEGAKVAVCGRHPEKKDAIDELASLYGSKFFWSACDISVPLQVSNFVKKVIYEFESVDVLVNNAAFFGNHEGITQCNAQTFKDMIQTNIVGTFNISRTVLLHMQERQYGKIICVTLRSPNTCEMPGSYYVSSSAIHAISNLIASEHAGTRITCNTIETPGIRTPEESAEHNPDQNKLLDDPSSLTRMFVYLASAESGGVSGKIFDSPLQNT